MKKTLILVATVLCITSTGALASNNVTNYVHTITSNERNSSGTVSEISSTEIIIIDDFSGEAISITHHGAQIEYVIGDLVSYRLITLPNGRTITKDIKKK